MTNSKNIDLFYDLIDEAVMLVYNETKQSYLEALVRVIDGLIGTIDDKGLSHEVINALEDTYLRISKTMFLNEEIRTSFNLLVIKGLKVSPYKLDIVTPDSLNFIIANIVNRFSNEYDTILDITMGIGNLLNTIANFCNHELKLIGVEKESLLADLARCGANLLEIESLIYCNDPLDINNLYPNIVVGDLGNFNGEEYKLLLNQVNSLDDEGLFIFVINNDFFTNPGVLELKDNFNGTLYGLIVLPDTMFKDASKKKSILIGTKNKINEQMMIVNMPSLSLEDRVIETMNIINQMIDKLKGMIR